VSTTTEMIQEHMWGQC